MILFSDFYMVNLCPPKGFHSHFSSLRETSLCNFSLGDKILSLLVASH
jgi:hypothetical protein